MSSEYSIIATTVFSEVAEVRFYEETIQHIQQNHPEVPILLPTIFGAVARAIIQPTHIESSYKNSFIFVDSETTDASGNPLRVPVRMIAGTSGRVTTTYFAETTGTPNVVWRR